MSATDIMGLDFVGAKKPMGGLTADHWKKYIRVLNENLAALWPVAYPHLALLQARIPKESELRYAMTVPLLLGDRYRKDGNWVTAKLNTYSGVDFRRNHDLTSSEIENLKKFVVFGREWSEGPLEVDDPSILPNQRGFRNMVGNIMQLAVDSVDGLYCRVYINVALGGYWQEVYWHCCTDSRCEVYDYQLKEVGIRLIFD